MNSSDFGDMIRVRFAGGFYREYSYRWAGAEPVEIGDVVLVPPGRWEPEGAPMKEATVTGLGSDYKGRRIVSLDQRAAK